MPSFRFSQDLVTFIDGHVPIWLLLPWHVVVAAAAICKCANYVPKAHCLQRLATAAKINNYKYANGARIAAAAVVVDSFIHKNRARAITTTATTTTAHVFIKQNNRLVWCAA